MLLIPTLGRQRLEARHMADIIPYQDRPCLLGPVSSHPERTPQCLLCITLEERPLSSGQIRLDQGSGTGCPNLCSLPSGPEEGLLLETRVVCFKGAADLCTERPLVAMPTQCSVPAPGDYHPGQPLAHFPALDLSNSWACSMGDSSTLKNQYVCLCIPVTAPHFYSLSLPKGSALHLTEVGVGHTHTYTPTHIHSCMHRIGASVQAARS